MPQDLVLFPERFGVDRDKIHRTSQWYCLRAERLEKLNHEVPRNRGMLVDPDHKASQGSCPKEIKIARPVGR
jgi:hypothetical protein